LHVKVLGPRPGIASAFKMLVAGLNKGVVALFLELSLAAQRAGLRADLLECCRESYPGVLDVGERTLPTYPEHAGRRGEEMHELELMLESLGLQPALVRGARQLLTEMGELHLTDATSTHSARSWTVQSVLDEVHCRGLLQQD